MKRIIAALALAFIAAVSVSGIELKNGRIKLVVDERTGRFALYYLVDVTRNQYRSLLYDQETRTTFPTLYLDQKTYKLGDASEFKVSASSRDATNYVVEYRSPACVVRQVFTFTTSAGSPMSDGMKLGFEIENVSDRDIVVGLRYLFDTWLGEKAGSHFSVSGGTVLATETLYSGSYTDTFISSGDGSVALSFPFGEPYTRPDRVLAANWKRLNDSLWNLESNASRNFTLLPYSINDSAIALYYDGAPLRRGAVRSVSILLTAANPSSQAAAPVAAGTAGIAAIPVSASLDLMADLISARSLLAAINQALVAGTSATDEQLKALRVILDRLEARKAGY